MMSSQTYLFWSNSVFANCVGGEVKYNKINVTQKVFSCFSTWTSAQSVQQHEFSNKDKPVRYKEFEGDARILRLKTDIVSQLHIWPQLI